MIRVILFLCIPFILCSQSTLKINEWATHLPYNNGEFVTQSDKFVYYSTQFALLKINKLDYSFEKISKTEGLSDSEIITLFFHKPSSSLIVCYKSGLIDIIQNDKVLALSDIVNFNNIPIDKTIQSITYFDESHIFINTSYGLSKVNVFTGRFLFTLFTPNKAILSSAKIGNQVFICTKNEVFLFDENAPGTIQDFGSWKKLEAADGLDVNALYNTVAIYKNNLYIASQQKIYKLAGDKFINWFSPSDEAIQYITCEGPHLLVCTLNKSNNLYYISLMDENANATVLPIECTENNIYGIEGDDESLWLADHRWGFRTLKNASSPCQLIFASGPGTKNVFDIQTLSDGIYIATGGVKLNYLPLFYSDGILKYSNNNWSSISVFSEPQIAAQGPFQDALRIAEHPDKNKIYCGSFGTGLLEWDRVTNKYTLYNTKNSILTGVEGGPESVRVVGLDFDSDKTLWIASYGGISALTSLDNSGNWKNHPINKYLFIEMKVDDNGFKWMLIRDGGVLVYDDKNNKQILLTSANSSLTTNDVRCIEIDLEGDVWIGTTEGPVIFECGASVFDGSCKGSRRKVNQDGIPYYLLSSELITSISVDGANRKWIGTSNNGVYVQSSSGEEQIHYFNSKNSPLLADNIIDIAVDPKNGDAWIGTERGLQVFRTDATGALDGFIESPTVFPNPVPLDYYGPIAIRGLARDATVKITDINGRLVFETRANGGQAIWDGMDYLGNKSVSGVYLVFANSTRDFETSEGIVTKIVLSR